LGLTYVIPATAAICSTQRWRVSLNLPRTSRTTIVTIVTIGDYVDKGPASRQMIGIFEQSRTVPSIHRGQGAAADK
jgi:hypothetical protein